ncbi:GNAT family N-acetyltransferase [Salimicrobium flavidum]|uniref:N-acetyltransferase domain-containing protein n=1 Tax=Salimicrobium flavidum TaxID=570947 RepID=A0A1N7KXU5_9BACI|nr:GNAT family N-acetyltransferase [Salimicrobium flavidum]SIS66452.1 hypothetical protein SAMN05421687_1236 [Salimicrobium flavidum]
MTRTLREETVRHQPRQESEKASFSLLDLTHISEVRRLQEKVKEEVQQQELLQELTEEELEFVLEARGIVVGVYAKENLIAFRAMMYPKADDPENLGKDLGLDTERVAHQEISCVHPDYQGNGLQKKMGETIMEEFRDERPDLIHVLCTVHPENEASLRDKFHHGMVIVELREKYAGKLRYIMYLPLQETLHVNAEKIISVPIEDIDQQKALLKENYIGYDYSNGKILYGKRDE